MARVLLLLARLTCSYAEVYTRHFVPSLTSLPKPDDFEAANFGDAASRAVSARFFANETMKNSTRGAALLSSGEEVYWQTI